MRRLARTIAAVILLAAAAVGLEALGRVYPDQLMPADWRRAYFISHYPFRTVPDPDVGFRMPSNQRTLIETHDYTYLLETDADGFPNREPRPARAAVVVLGDSLATAPGVAFDKGFVQLLAAARPGEAVVNFAVAAAGPERQHAIFRKYGAALEPRVVMACIYPASDFENDEPFRAWLAAEPRPDYDRFRLDTAVQAHDPGWLGRQVQKSWMYTSVREAALTVWEGDAHLPQHRRLPDGTDLLFGRNELAFASTAVAPDDPRLQPLVDAVVRFRDAAAHAGATFVVVLIPSKEEIFAVAPERTAANLASRAEARLREAGLAVVSLYAPLRRLGETRAPFFSQDSHLTEAGNRVAADELRRWLDEHAPAAAGARRPEND
ncbi:MAG: hypothetical protein AB7O28_15280 [Vicinamibacterales bacterium]